MSVPDPEVQDLVNGCVRGERKYQQMLFERFYGKMIVVSMRYVPDRDEAQDVLQESFIKVFQNIGKFDFHGSFEGWVRRIVVNTAIDYLRKKKNAPKMVDQDYTLNNLTEEDEEETTAVFLQLKPKEVLEAVQKLTPAYRTVFNLYVMDGYSHQQIADSLKISVGTSKSNLSKAKQNLQKLLKSKLTELNES